jgi:uncharacterized membrane protein
MSTTLQSGTINRYFTDIFVKMKINMKKKILWGMLIFFSVVTGLYPLKYYWLKTDIELTGPESGLVLEEIIRNYIFYIHIILGGVALLIGWTQFSSKYRTIYRVLHQRIGKLYVISALLSSVSGLYIALYANGGFVARSGFFCLGVIWFYTTLVAYTSIRNKQLITHQKMMIFSYAACFAAVTLRLWLPLLIVITGDFKTAYIIVAWWSWIPNLVVAALIIRRLPIKP